MRRHGFALAETLVAVAIGGLLATTLLAVNIDYIRLAKGAFALLQDDQTQARLAPAVGFRQDPCSQPDAVLRTDGHVLTMDAGGTAATLLRLDHGRFLGRGGLSLSEAAASSRFRAVSATQTTGAAWPGRSMALVEDADGPKAVFSLRCDVPEVCDLDALSKACRGF